MKWTAESFEAHIEAIFRDIEAKAKAAKSSAELAPLRHRLDQEWQDPKPGAFLPTELFEPLKLRLRAVHNIITECFATLKEAGEDSQVDGQVVLEPGEPTPSIFFRGDRHWSDPPDADEALVQATEERLGITLPNLLKTLYLIQNGGGSDFVFSAIMPGASTAPAEKDFFELWRASLPDNALLPIGELMTMAELQETFDYDPDYSWRKHLPGADRLVRISQHAWDVYLCLDYGDRQSEPGVVLFDDARWDPGSNTPFEAVWPDFATFFASLRRPTLTERYGLLYRGISLAGPRDHQAAERS